MPQKDLPPKSRKRARESENQVSKKPIYTGKRFYLYLESFEESDNQTDSYSVTFECTPAYIMLGFLESDVPEFQFFDTATFLVTYENVTTDQLKAILYPTPTMNWESNYIEGSWYLADGTKTENLTRDEQNHMVHIDSFVNDPNTDVYSLNLKWLSLLAYPSTHGLRRSGNIVYNAVTWDSLLRTIPAKFGFDVYNGYNPDELLVRAFESPGQSFNQNTSFLKNAITADGDITSISIMDLGIAGCNLLIANDEPVCYFDAGSPLPSYNKTFPTGFTGPIDGFPVILSHWDWDHWSLVLRYPSLKDVMWHVNKKSPLSGKAASFKSGQKTAGNLVEYSSIKKGFIKNIDLYICSTSRSSGGFAKNNTGLAIVVKNLELGGKLGDVIMTGDANFNSASLSKKVNPIGVNAVHHGSKNEKASENLPKPRALDKKTKDAEDFEGRIAYAYGMSNAGKNKPWKRPYGFPAQLAITNYRAAGWGIENPSANEASTAEGTLLNNTPNPTKDDEQPPNRGNIRMADQTALKDKYNTSSFYAIKHKLQ
jgi:hypothetical protein